MMVGEHEIQTFKAMVFFVVTFAIVVRCFMSPQVHIPCYYYYLRGNDIALK
jgi:hypothetical protein